MISDNPNVSFGIVDCSFFTRPIVLKDGYHGKRKEMLAYIPAEFKDLETLAKTFIISAGQNQFIQDKHFQQCSSSLDCYWNEYKLCINRILYWKSIPVWTIWSQTN